MTDPEVRAAYEAFSRARSRAGYRLFEEFVIGRGLDLDDQYWPEADRDEFDRRSDEQIKYWNAKAEELVAAAESGQLDTFTM
ncbi:hypothetical protein [Prescottella agglutinans]|uniref:Uncharacterized protein n=1 Tax=Prescottella agglutinans TaxID=1644129 RepID=A0ABT6MFL4_9NOCA|nr:hypothetical protein [Prescottella agglutinans]MDH6283114.1 hypothetical protein [Prescottella agglutinans]